MWDRVILAGLPLLISVVICVASETPARLNTTAEKSYRQVPINQIPAGEFNLFNSHDVRHHSERSENSAPTFEPPTRVSHPKFLNSNSTFILTKNGGIPVSSAAKPKHPASDCFWGKNCPEANPDEDSSSYHSVMNRKKDGNPFSHKIRGAFEPLSFGDARTASASLPFIVQAPNSNNPRIDSPKIGLFPTSTRRPPTTNPTAEADWVKMEPLNPVRTYDPFFQNGSSKDNSTTFASRQGIELNPDTFAERHGWKDGKYGGPGGSKLPAWLEELNFQHGGYGNRRQSYEPDHPSSERDENRWVKLEAVPVKGVKISKWVPKNTAPSELPSTSWKYSPKPNSWWDRLDHNNNQEADGSQANQNRGPFAQSQIQTWPARYPQRPSLQPFQQYSGDAWSDVIYPNNPISATASWASDRKPPLRSPSWNKAPPGNRYPVASWSANENGSNRASGSNGPNSYPYARPPSRYGAGKPPYYPDPDGKPDDQQWVLISTSKNQQHAEGSHKYASYEEFLYPYNTRHSKGLNIPQGNKFGVPRGSPAGPLTQDELFRRTNNTLHSLKPALNHNRYLGTTEHPPLNQNNLIDILSSPATNIAESTTIKYNDLRIGHSTSPATTTRRAGTAAPTRNKDEINPVSVAGAAGMIPATFGAFAPLLFNGNGRKRRTAGEFQTAHATSQY